MSSRLINGNHWASGFVHGGGRERESAGGEKASEGERERELRRQTAPHACHYTKGTMKNTIVRVIKSNHTARKSKENEKTSAVRMSARKY